MEKYHETALEEVAAHLQAGGFPPFCICPFSRAYAIPLESRDDPEEAFREYPVVSLPLPRQIDATLEEWRQRAAQCLLDAGYRGFISKIETHAGHTEYAPAAHTPDDYSGIVFIEFLNGITRYTPDQIEQNLAKGAQARIKAAELAERARAKREAKSLDKGLRKIGLID